ncbi:MAG: hydrogenase iron-sulfur subunit [Anaerolineae bacterium]
MTKLVIIGCDRSAGEALRSLAESGYSLPKEAVFRTLPCGGSLDAVDILRALESGAEQVLVLSCFAEACRSYNGHAWAEKRSAGVQALLKDAGLDDTRVIYRQVSPNMAADLAIWVSNLVNSAAIESQAEQA